jgi:arsenate reductase
MSKLTAELYWMPACSTCQKAKAFLEEHGVEVTSTHDMKASPLDKATIAKLAEGVGGVEAIFSKRAMKYRQLGLHEQSLTDEQMLDHMAGEYTFITRPVMLFSNGEVKRGFAPKQLEAYLNNA